MNSVIVDAAEPITLVGGGAARMAELEAARKHAPDVVAADGGAAFCLAAGVMPRAVIGDMDSLDAETRAAIDPARVHEIAEQDSTDFDKAIRSVAAPLLIGVGFMGKRVDHQLAALNRLAARPDRRIVLLDAEDVICHCPPRLTLDMAPGTRVSLFPMARVRGRSQGLHWPIDGIAMAPDARIGTSNRAEGPVVLDMDGPGMLVIVPRDCLTQVVQRVQAAAPWPVRAE